MYVYVHTYTYISTYVYRIKTEHPFLVEVSAEDEGDGIVILPRR